MAISQWPDRERPREKLLERGPQALSDAELLAIFLRTGTRGESAVDLARRLLREFGSLRALLTTDPKRLREVRGLGLAKSVLLVAALELGRRYLEESFFREDPLTSPDLVRRYLTYKLRDRSYEVFAVLFLDTQHRPIAFEELFRGTVNASAVYPREVAKRALEHNASALIVVHNHPSGCAQPSLADRQMTETLKEALSLFEIDLLDHFIVGDGELFSFAEAGLL